MLSKMQSRPLAAMLTTASAPSPLLCACGTQVNFGPATPAPAPVDQPMDAGYWFVVYVLHNTFAFVINDLIVVRNTIE